MKSDKMNTVYPLFFRFLSSKYNYDATAKILDKYNDSLTKNKLPYEYMEAILTEIDTTHLDLAVDTKKVIKQLNYCNIGVISIKDPPLKIINFEKVIIEDITYNVVGIIYSPLELYIFLDNFYGSKDALYKVKAVRGFTCELTQEGKNDE